MAYPVDIPQRLLLLGQQQDTLFINRVISLPIQKLPAEVGNWVCHHHLDSELLLHPHWRHLFVTQMSEQGQGSS